MNTWREIWQLKKRVSRLEFIVGFLIAIIFGLILIIFI